MRAAWLLADAEATQQLGATLGHHCPWGSAARCVYLRGELGAGKTTLAAGLLGALGVQGPVRSPSYALIEIYGVSAGLAVHVDLYRLRGPEELEQLGLRDYLQAQTLLLIEWPESSLGPLPPADLTVTLTPTDEGRSCLLEASSPIGEAWLALVANAFPPSDTV